MTLSPKHRMFEGEQNGTSEGLLRRYRNLCRTPGGRVESRGPHPGDVLYWVGCVGAISALLFVAMR